MKKLLKTERLRICASGLFICFCAVFLAACDPPIREASFTVSWSPDGSQAAFVPDPDEEQAGESGVWIYDAMTGEVRRIFTAPEEFLCYYPQWSPFGNEILFSQIPRDRRTDENGSELFPATLWILDVASGHIQRVGETEFLKRDCWLTALAWGPIPNTILYQKAVDDETFSVLQLDLMTGKKWSFLPREVPLYAFVPSPSREKVAALLFFPDGNGLAEVFVADFRLRNWESLGVIYSEFTGLEGFQPLIYWSPDSSRFVVVECEERIDPRGSNESYLRLYDLRWTESWRIAPGTTTSSILWDRNGQELMASMYQSGLIDPERLLERINVVTGEITEIARGNDLHLLAWNQTDGRIYFSESSDLPKDDPKKKTVQVHRFYSCRADGQDRLELDWSFVDGSFAWSASPAGLHMLIYRDDLPFSAVSLAQGPTVRFLFEALDQ